MTWIKIKKNLIFQINFEMTKVQKVMSVNGPDNENFRNKN